jgi:hypothetical protein
MFPIRCSIIYDANNIFTFEDGHKQLEMPSISSTTMYSKGKLYDKRIRYTLTYNIRYHMDYLLNKKLDLKFNKKLNPVSHDALITPYYIKWTDINKYYIRMVCSIPWYDQIKSGMLFTKTQPVANVHDSSNDEFEAFRTPREIALSNKPKCFITNTNLYDDCYVLDIYEQTVTTLIKKKHAKEYKKDTKTQEDTESYSVIKEVKIMESGDVNITAVYKYKTPRYILLSATAFIHYIVHHVKDKDPIYTYNRLFDYLQKMIGCKFILYRTRCPIKCTEIIDTLDIPELEKEILKAFNTLPIRVNQEVYSCSSLDKNYILSHIDDATICYDRDNNPKNIYGFY